MNQKRITKKPSGLYERGEASYRYRGKLTDYAFWEVECSIGGRGFAMLKLADDGPGYHTRVSLDAKDCACSCRGFARYNRCRHILMLLEMLE